MTKVFQVGSAGVNLEDLPSLLKRYQFLPHLYRQLIIDQAIAGLECSPEEKAVALATFYEQQQIASEDDRQAWLQKNDMTLEDLEAQSIRHVLVSKFKETAFTPQVETYFMKRKPDLDQVIYSLIRTDDIHLAQELYFRIQEGECAFADIARQYSQGMEASTGGMIGPTALSAPHPEITRILSSSKPGHLYTPVRLEQWVIILRLERLIPAQLDEMTRQRLIDELFERWLQKQTQAASRQALAISRHLEPELTSAVKVADPPPQAQQQPKADAEPAAIPAPPPPPLKLPIPPPPPLPPLRQQAVEPTIQPQHPPHKQLSDRGISAIDPATVEVDTQGLMQMPLDELTAIVDKLGQDLEKMSSFVNEQEEELSLLGKTIAALQHQISRVSEYERLTLSVDLEAELQRHHFLDQALQGQRQRVQKCQYLLNVHADTLQSRQNMLKLLLDFYTPEDQTLVKENAAEPLNQDQTFLSLINLVQGVVSTQLQNQAGQAQADE
ncbi:MAG: peptidylprolyl isomerase [Aphanocapsa sp. GSE-SYN-MK-11-07L]|jgi:parvulin-like peptidyl-prolyl isomerase|nr:peptidylprolyl isomerase [Aphanocapsa sp. GSE-SYN-MK-11-07L]